MSLSLLDQEEIDNLFVSLNHGDAMERADARAKLDALQRVSADHHNYIAHQVALDAELAHQSRELRQQGSCLATPKARPAPVSGVRGWWVSQFRTVSVALACMLAAVAVWVTNPVISRQTGVAAIGQQTTLALDDGSSVLLNTDTSLRYTRRLRSREIVLERGEALFTVIHRKWQPLHVQAGVTMIEDIGTRFSVRRRSDGVQVAVLEGRVSVHSPARSIPITLVANDAIQTTGGKITPLNPNELVAWKDHRLDFDRMSLAEVVHEIQRYRVAPILVADTPAGRLRITGGFSSRNPDQLLRALPSVVPVSVTFQVDGSAVIASR